MRKHADEVLTTKEACRYLKISSPTFFRLIRTQQIRARKIGRGWKVRKSQLEEFLRGEDEDSGEGARRICSG
jgi:excisionase family DNA binding protein